MIYIELADGSLARWNRSLAELEELLFNLENRGYSASVRWLE